MLTADRRCEPTPTDRTSADGADDLVEEQGGPAVGRLPPSGPSIAPTDAALVAGCRAGDPEAWRVLVKRYEGLVYSIPIRLGLGADDAADITQTAFALLLRSLDVIRKPESVGGWLSTVARRLAWQLLAKRDTEFASGLALQEIEVGDDRIDRVASRYWVHEAVLRLPEPGRTVVLELYFNPEPPSYEELARRLGRPIGSIGPLRARALARLRLLLDEG